MGAVTSKRSVLSRMLLYVCIGTADWIVFVALEARHNANYSGDPYWVVIILTALIIGASDRRLSHLRAPFLLIAPAILLSVWTAPQGDNDGLQILWPFVLFLFAFVAAGAHWIGSKIPGR